MTIRGKISVSRAEMPQTKRAAKAACDGTGPMNLKYPEPSEPLEMLAAIQTKSESNPIEINNVTTSRHLTIKESDVATESPCADHLSRGSKK